MFFANQFKQTLQWPCDSVETKFVFLARTFQRLWLNLIELIGSLDLIEIFTHIKRASNILEMNMPHA